MEIPAETLRARIVNVFRPGARLSNASRVSGSRAPRGTACEFGPSFAGGAGLLGACLHFSDMLLVLVLIWLVIVLPAAVGSAQRAVAPKPAAFAAQGAVTARVVAAANAFLATLGDTERARCTFGFTSSQRTGWSNLPTGIFQRNGLRLGDMTSRQRDAALALVAAALSREGYKKVTDIMNGDEVLKKSGGGRTGGRQGAAGPGGAGARGGGVRFGLDEYY